ncbi:uncharacterized protein LOC124284987 [Haliotis rubra]|uniref:uncharacterized protein LOC124284987 n=1 Tax=Haliotis rubra TaxID=36100 RepID=UPI001EE5193C|nr:uncharacterized protein LOC124284987 [Haliotis rubra]
MIRYASFVLLVLAECVYARVHITTTTTPFPRGNLQVRMDNFKVKMEAMLQQMIQQQLYVEERIRSDGQSGIKQIRQYHDGPRPYDSESHTYKTAFAVHDHANYDRTVGMGEVNMVMNGVEFRTRHNDYKLRMPSRKSAAYRATEDIPFPSVPPQVTSKKTLPEQVAEMKAWFKAWQDQNHSVRDYRKYFKPVLCYMEGAWTQNTTHIQEPFSSDRHAIDATSWEDLQEKVRFTTYSGSKSFQENFAFLPTTIMEVVNGQPVFAQWNYRILCHPLTRDLPLKYLNLQDDLSARISRGQTKSQLLHDPAARFSLFDGDEGRNYTLLDELMSEIPGLNNYNANLKEDVFGQQLYDVSDNAPMNTANYHRWYKVGKGGAKEQLMHRGFSDMSLFVAQTTQSEISPMKVEQCTVNPVSKHKTCQSWSRRYSYAVPLEVIYLTPVLSWNPFNLDFWSKGSQGPNKQRVGGNTPQTAYNGSSYHAYYRTPPTLFSGQGVSLNHASIVGVLDKHGKVQQVAASGPRVLLPNIPGMGKIRMRYPIAPIHGEGSGVWKELDALKDMMMDIEKYKGLFEEPPTMDGSHTGMLHLRTGVATKTPPGPHVHEIYVSQDVQAQMAGGRRVRMLTSKAQGHTHQLLIDGRNHKYSIFNCDGKPRCWDGHPSSLYVV